MELKDPLWDKICNQARRAVTQEPLMADFFDTAILSHASLDQALCFNLSQQMGSPVVSAQVVSDVIAEALQQDASIGERIRRDINACFDRDPACETHFMP
ncbi:MAG: serine O-acetyltransferase, partial [Porticoccaceae bacterium]